MVRYLKFFEYTYLAISVFFLYKTYEVWYAEPQRAYLYLIFTLAAIGMYFFRRKNRKKYENFHKD